MCVCGTCPGCTEDVASFKEFSQPLEPRLHFDCIHGERKERSLREGCHLHRERKVLILTSTARSAQPRGHCIAGSVWVAAACPAAGEKGKEMEAASEMRFLLGGGDKDRNEWEECWIGPEAK
jgi:hypothetical protein